MVEMNIEQRRALAAAKARQASARAGGQEQGADILLNQIRAQRGERPEPGAVGTVGDFVRMVPQGMGENIPIAGPLVSRAADTVGSHIAAAITGETPQEALDRAAAMKAEDRSTLAGQAGYGIGAGLGMVGPLAQIGASSSVASKALGMSGNLPSRILAGAVSGTGIAGADAVARGEAPQDALNTAMVGGALGAGFPVAGASLNAVRAALAGKPLTSAEAIIARALSDDQIPAAAVPERLAALGPDAVIADLGPNLQRQAGALASIPGEAQRVVRQTLMQRADGTNARIQGDVDAILGPSPIPSRLQADISTGQDALSPAYAEVFQNAVPVDARPLAQTFNAMAQQYKIGQRRAAMDRLGAWLTETDDTGRQFLTSDPSRLFAMRNELDDMIQTEVGTRMGAALTSARQQVDDLLATGVPGIKEVDARYEELARQNTAIGQGSSVLASGKEAPRPVEVVDMMSPEPASELFVGPSGVPFRVTQGARAEIDRIIGTTANNLTALKSALKGDGSWNRERLATMFGQQKADALINVLDRERTFALTNHLVNQNSETAARNAAQREFEAGTPGIHRDTSTMGLILTALQKVANVGAGWRQDGTNARVAAALMGQEVDPAMMLAIEHALAGQGKRSALAPSGMALITQALTDQ